MTAATPDMREALEAFVKAFESAHPDAVGKDEDWLYDEHRGIGVAYLAALAALAKARP